MTRLKIIADGASDKAKSNARGKLFEEVSAQILRHNGYEIDSKRTNVTYSGMEIDIEGRARVTGLPLYAECKCYSSDIISEKIQTFYGKYMTKWFSDKRCHGLFIAIPALNSHAMGFYRDNCESNDRITIRLLQENQVLNALIESKIVISPDEISRKINHSMGTPGDKVLVCSDFGFFWLQYIVPTGSGIASKIQIFDSLGHAIFERDTLDYFSRLIPEIREFEIINNFKERYPSKTAEISETIVELRGSSSCFEYQFPASPEFFVGRPDILKSIKQYIVEIKSHTTSCRGILFEANSGWGKSSLVLATVSWLQQQGHYAVAIDSRSASTSQFLLRSIEHIINKFKDFGGILDGMPILSGFDGAIQTFIEIGEKLKSENKLLFVFFDQFENLFSLSEVLSQIAQFALKINDAKTNIVLGFSWKTDLIGLTREFPYRWRDTIINSCRVFKLKQFSELETNELLDRLSKELHSTLRKDLHFLLSEFSQGYPWLLKKLCAHVKNLRTQGISQEEIARGLLNVEQLFAEDLNGLDADQEDSLKRISKLVPVSVSEIAEDFNPAVIQSLVDRRLIVRVGLKYDVYWDIFRDYLNTGKLPIDEVYLLRAQVGSVLRALRILQQSRGKINTDSFKLKASLSDGAFMNIARDLRLLQLANIDAGEISLNISLGESDDEIILNLRDYLHDRLQRNRCVHRILKTLRELGEIKITDLSVLLKKEFPYISARENTWATYSRLMASWLDISDLGVLDKNNNRILDYRVGSQIRDRRLILAPRRSETKVPSIHFSPILKVAKRLILAVQNNDSIDWDGIPKSTIYKSLSMMEEMGLISRKSNTIMVHPDCNSFVSDSEKRHEIVMKAATSWPIFNIFLDILNDTKYSKLTYKKIGDLVSEKYNLEWKDETAKTNVKIMLDWARHLKLAPNRYAFSHRGKFKKNISNFQKKLF
jgi:Restriction endonuclease